MSAINNNTINKIVGNTQKRINQIRNQLSILTQDGGALIGLFILAIFIFLGIFGPLIAPHDPINDFVRQNGHILRLSKPSMAAPLGTTQYGQDILSQFLVGARPTLIAGIIGGVFAGILGFFVGLASGYFGSWIDEILMRITDLFFAIPALPFDLLILSVFKVNIWTISGAILLTSWKIPARVIRSEVMTVKNRTYVKSERAAGASHMRTMLVSVAPNVLPIAFLYAAYSVGWAIITQSALAFLGFGDPSTTSWGQMLRIVFSTGVMQQAWWWAFPPIIGIAAVTVSVFFIGRAYEEVVNPEISL